jgi:hypothetical protein
MCFLIRFEKKKVKLGVRKSANERDEGGNVPERMRGHIGNRAPYFVCTPQFEIEMNLDDPT